jgi:hypothetical protein
MLPYRCIARAGVAALVLFISSFSGVVVAEHVPESAPAMVVTFDQEQGVGFTDTVHLNGTSNQPLRNTSWTVVNISGSTPITLLSGPYLTSVTPIAEGLYRWSLVVDLVNVDCTCYIELMTVDEQHRPVSISRVVYLGSHQHRPVFMQTSVLATQMDPLQASPHLLGPTASVGLTLIQPGNSSSTITVLADVCEAPFGVCLAAPFSVDVPFRLEHQSIFLDLDAGAMALTEGIWQLSVTASDDLLRSTHAVSMTLIYDVTPPQTHLSLPSLVDEGEAFLVFVEVDDGYEGSSSTLTWNLVQQDGTKRSPRADERFSDGQLQLNLSESGTYLVEVTVRDHAGNTVKASQQVIVENIKPIARISVDGLTAPSTATVKLGPAMNWSLSGNSSEDNEPVEFLWVINNDSSIRGVSSLDVSHFPTTGRYSVELIVFDDDGATNSTYIEVEILGLSQPPASESSWSGMAFVASILFLSLAIVLFLKRQRVVEIDLPRWESGSLVENRYGFSAGGFDATIQEDET